MEPEGDEEKFLRIVSDLIRLRADQEALTWHLLRQVILVVPASGPCSLLRLSTFFSERDPMGRKGRITEAPKNVQVPNQLLVQHWMKHIKNSASLIEEAIYRIHQERGRPDVGTARLAELFRPKSSWWQRWKQDKLHSLVEYAGLHDLAYLWIRCAPDDLWAVCLRRTRSDALFSDEEMERLERLGRFLLLTRDHWYAHCLRGLTPAQRRVVATMAYEGLKAEEAASRLNMKVSSYRSHLKRIYLDLEVNSELSLMAKVNARDANEPPLPQADEGA